MSTAAAELSHRVDDIRAAVAACVRASELRSDPSPHIFIEGIFPADFYRALMAHFPADGIYVNVDRSGNPHGRHRRRVNLTRDMERIDPSARAYWHTVRESIASPEFVTALYDKFAAPLAQRYGSKFPDVRVRLELMRDSSGYAIGPHTDAPHKVFTGLFYLPADNSQADLGTSMYAPKEAGFVDDSGRQYPFELFEECTKIPFVPNSLFLFMKTQNSFHGRCELPEGIAPRNWMNCSVQIASSFTL
ncbi:MAG TPA: hypothetical protein VFB31_02190 [Pseudolabrys sp.]|nr:hypothetical protein [Pseudolabrys sp.]